MFPPVPMTAESDQIRASEAARLLGISISTLRRWCDDGVVPYWLTPTGQRRFSREDLETWRADRERR